MLYHSSPLLLLLLTTSLIISNSITAVVGKECIFLHGSGQHTNQPPTSTFASYWGDVDVLTPQCTSHVFVHANTDTNLFDNNFLMSYYCNVSVLGSLVIGKSVGEVVGDFVSGGGNMGLIQNKIVFTHSMGNNILAAAIKNGICDLDSTSTWYEVSGPIHGSKAADFLEQICTQNVSAPLQWLGKELGLCLNGNESLSNWGLRPEYPGLIGLDGIIKSRISGALCGDSPLGIFTKYSIPLEALAAFVKYPEASDGMVPISSCMITGSFGSDPTSAFYLGKFNHADTTCRNGGEPCKWYSLRT